MGEIKSTLDLVLERTRHLSLSDEEKARQQKADFDKRLQGLLQQYADGILSVDTLQDRTASLRAELGVKDRGVLAAAIVGRIDPDQDNRRWLALMGTTAPALRHPLEDILNDFSHRKRETLQKSEDRLRERLASQHGIAGSAVVPNPLKDSTCREDLAALRQQALDQLEAAFDQALQSDQK
jgi:hypothetical protein